MFETLDTIDWEIRNASDVPHWLRQLCSSDLESARRAGQHIADDVIKIWHQDHWHDDGISRILDTDVPLLIVPFLIEVLDIDTKINKTSILTLLIGLSDYEYMHYEGDVYAKRAHQVHEAVWNGHLVYLKLLKHPEDRVRLETVGLLSNFKDHANVVVPNLREAILNEPNSDIQQKMVKCMKEFFPDEVDGLTT